MINNSNMPPEDLNSVNDADKSEEEENTVIADMSMIDGGNSLGHMFRSKKKEGNNSHFKLTHWELRALLRGTICASLLIGLVYVVAFALIILIMVLIWR